jgi:hypothetical protein
MKALLSFRNVVNTSPNDMASHPRKLETSTTPLWERHIWRGYWGPHSEFVIMYFRNQPSLKLQPLSCGVCRIFWRCDGVFIEEKAGNSQVNRLLLIMHCYNDFMHLTISAVKFSKTVCRTKFLPHKKHSITITKYNIITPIKDITAIYAENRYENRWYTHIHRIMLIQIQSNPVVTTSVYATPRL